MQVVKANESQPENFLRLDQVPQVTPGKLAACRAGAALVDGALVEDERRVFKVERAAGGECGAVAGETGGEIRVEGEGVSVWEAGEV